MGTSRIRIRIRKKLLGIRNTGNQNWSPKAAMQKSWKSDFHSQDRWEDYN